jgi:hypothetical protein
MVSPDNSDAWVMACHDQARRLAVISSIVSLKTTVFSSKNKKLAR